MKAIVFGTSLFIAVWATGCTTHTQLHQSLLIHENQRLENALYTAHAQVADLKRENNLLRKQQTTGPDDTDYQESWNEDWNIDLPLEMPKVILPEQPGTTEVPELMRESQTIWSPVR